MAFCRSCGSQLEDGKKFCGNCGAPVQHAQPQNTNTYYNNTNYAQQTSYIRPDGYDAADVEKNKGICALSYLSVLFFLPLVVCPESRFGKFHANQALILLIASSILGTASSFVMGFIQGILSFVSEDLAAISVIMVGLAVGALPFAATIFGIVTAIQGTAKELPLIGKFNILNK